MNTILLNDDEFFDIIELCFGFDFADIFADCLSDCAPQQYVERVNNTLFLRDHRTNNSEF